jgi:hypothetical protein
MTYFLAIFAVWIVLTLQGSFFTTPDWFPHSLGIACGLGLQALLDIDHWYLGIGIGGAASFLILVGDLLLVTTDAIRAGVLVKLGRRS